MDFYNPLYWSSQDGIYSAWNSVYPPLNFIFLQIYQQFFMDEFLAIRDAFEIRNFFYDNVYFLIGIYVFSISIALGISFRKIITIKLQIVILIICLLSPAFLFALERGNLIIISIPILSWYITTKSQINRAIALAMLINLKPYFVIFFIVEIINSRFHKDNKDFWFLAPVFSLILFLFTGLILNQEFYLMPLNLLGFATNRAVLSSSEVLAFPSSMIAFGYFKGLVSQSSIATLIGYLAQLAIFIYIAKTLLFLYKFKINTEDLAIFSIILITNFSISTGGYGILYYISAIGVLYKQKNYCLIVIISVGMYLGIWDAMPIYYYSGGEMMVYLSGELAKVEPFISLGALIRPIANFIVLVLFYKVLEKRYSDA